MIDEVLEKALSTDSSVIPRYDIVDANGNTVAENATLTLKNAVSTTGSAWSKANVLPDSVAELLGLDPDDDPQVKDALSMIVPENVTFANASYERLDAIATSGAASILWNIGDTREETLTTGEVITLRIEDFDHDNLADGSGKAGVTISMVNNLNTATQMNTSSTNVGGYSATDIENITLPGVKATLPAPLQAIIKSVTKITQEGSQSPNLTTTTDDLWLFSFTEVGLTNTYFSPGNEGDSYPLFVDSASRIKMTDGSAMGWWLRSPALSNSTSFCMVSSLGDGVINLAIISGGVCFGFCI